MATSFDGIEDDDQDLASDDFDFRPRGSYASETGYEEGLNNEVNEEDIRRIAAALAPQMSELEEFLKGMAASDDYVSSTFELSETTNRSMRDENDDLDDELKMLAMSEQALREELEFAQDMKDMLTPFIDDRGKEEPLTPIERPVLPAPESRASIDPPEIVKPPKTYSLQDHADYLKLRTEKMGGWYYCDMSRFIQADLESECNKDLVKDYCLPIPFRKLKRLYCGLVYHHVTPTKPHQVLSTPARGLASPVPSMSVDSSLPRTPIRTPGKATMPATPITPANIPAPPPLPQEEPLPVRTVAMRIRPDVLVGAVMEAINHAFEVMPSNCTSHVLKRQGGHLRAAVYMPDKPLAYVADCQLCTQKNDELERRLIVRFYHIQDDPDAMHELGQLLHQKNDATTSSDTARFSQNEGESNNNNNMMANYHMKESCSLIQRLLATQQLGGPSKMDLKQQASWLGVRDMAFPTMHEMQRAVGIHLASNYNPCPSVREENKKSTPTIRRLTLPSLSPKDWALVEVSWYLTNSIFDELDTRDCSYNTMMSLPFGQFPALQTLDVHFCSQLRRVSRESMINHLLKSAKDLEAYAKGAEYNCAICISLLEPMLVHYGIPPLGLPNTSKSLQDYPLDYTLPQVACPPWGSLVSQALNYVQSQTPTNDIDATVAVKLVYDAFVRQDDEEQSARLGRKNAQIMDRLATLQKHQRALVQNIRDAHVYSEKAAHEAAAFLKKAQKALNAGQPGYPRALQPEVPLLSFRISQGASTSGTCFISGSQILFVTTFIPLVGGSRSMLFDLLKVEFQVDESVPATLLNPFPNTMNVVISISKEVAFRFRPSLSPTRLFKFLKVIQSFANEEQPSEFSEVVDNLNIVKEDDEKKALVEVLSDDHFSV